MKYIYGSISKIILCMVFLNTMQINEGLGQSFSSSDLGNASIGNPTSLQFGPDGKLYVAQQDGTVRIYTITKNGPNDYEATNTEILTLVKHIPNHNDDGTPYNPSYKKRQCTGLLVAGTSSDPIVYVSSSDDRIGAGEWGDVNLCTNSGIISKLYKEGGVWKKIDLVRGLPRSEENHAPNGMQLHGDTLLIAIGGFTNSGGPSKLWTYITEYALSAAILAIDLSVIEALPTKMDPTGNHPFKYDIPTLDDPTRSNNPDGTDVNDPWGGNDGMNQAKIVSGGPVQIFAGGFRNAYDILISKHPTRTGRVYTIDNGPNRNWGGWPVNEGSDGTVTNEYPVGEPGSLTVGNYDGLEFIGNIQTYVPGSYHGGHPVPIRANPAGAGLYSDDGTHKGWRNDNSDPDLPLPSDWPPVPLSMANPDEGDYLDATSSDDKSLIYWRSSVNGFCEYLYSGNALYGDLLAAGFDGNIYRVKMNTSHQVVNTLDANRINQDAPFATGFGNKPLDIIAQGDGEPFAGTIWLATWGSSKITIFEPQSISCPLSDPSADDDGDGYSNQDETDSGTDPCSGSNKPNDNDGDFISDKNDDDDDNDGINDWEDYFAIDPDNGMTTGIPTHYNLFNYDPGTGFFGLGFTGLMSNGTTDYLELFEESNLVAGGAAGAFTIEQVPTGDALGNFNTQEYAFQFGVKTAGEGTFTVKAGILPLYFNHTTPQDFQSQGIFIGNGDQDNYLKVALNSNGGSGGIEVVHEVDGVASSNQYALPGGIPSNTLKFYITVDPSSEKAYVKYSIGNDAPVSLGGPITVTGKLLNAITNSGEAMAVGVISTSRNATIFNASWDYIEVYGGSITSVTKWNGGIINENIHLYPNPTKDKVMISFEGKLNSSYKLRLLNNLGQLVKTGMVKSSSGHDSEFDISEIPNGIYYLQFLTEDEQHSATVKLVKD